MSLVENKLSLPLYLWHLERQRLESRGRLEDGGTKRTTTQVLEQTVVDTMELVYFTIDSDSPITTMCDGVRHCLWFVFNVFLVSLHGD